MSTTYDIIKPMPKTSDLHTLNGSELWLIRSGGQSIRRKFCDLPAGNYSIVGLAKDLEMPDWVLIIGHFKNSNEFLKSLGLENKNVLILKIEKL